MDLPTTSIQLDSPEATIKEEDGAEREVTVPDQEGSRPSTPHFHGFDLLRVAGILAVIYIHGCDTNDLARRGMKWLGFAVPCFFMMSAFLTQQSVLSRDASYADWIRRKFKRLAPAFFAWSSVYFAIRSAKAIATGQSMDSGLIGCLFWGDASHQLYFVPMLFYSFVIWTPVMILARRYQMPVAALLVIATAGFVIAEQPLNEMLPSHRWFIGKNLVWFPIGMLAALATQRLGESRRVLLWPAAVAVVAMVATDFVNVYAISLGAFVLSLSIQRKTPHWIETLAVYSFGVYLAHVLFIESMQFVAPRIGLRTDSLGVTLGITLISAVLSYLVCFLLGSNRSTRWSVT